MGPETWNDFAGKASIKLSDQIKPEQKYYYVSQ
jgi:hypothetical protein